MRTYKLIVQYTRPGPERRLGEPQEFPGLSAQQAYTGLSAFMRDMTMAGSAVGRLAVEPEPAREPAAELPCTCDSTGPETCQAHNVLVAGTSCSIVVAHNSHRVADGTRCPGREPEPAASAALAAMEVQDGPLYGPMSAHYGQPMRATAPGLGCAATRAYGPTGCT